MASELKPCPLCSADPSSKFTDIKAAIWCEPCGLHMEYSTAMVSLRIAEEHQRSILTKRWNTRPTPVAPVSPDATGKCVFPHCECSMGAAERCKKPTGRPSPIMEALKIVRETNDKGRQALQAWSDSKASPTSGKCGVLETVGNISEECLSELKQMLCGEIHPCNDIGDITDADIELVARSQAVELLAAKDARIERLERKERFWLDKNDNLEADNAALTARVKELEADVKREAQSSTHNAQDCLDEQLRAEALEAKLAAAEKLGVRHE